MKKENTKCEKCNSENMIREFCPQEKRIVRRSYSKTEWYVNICKDCGDKWFEQVQPEKI